MIHALSPAKVPAKPRRALCQEGGTREAYKYICKYKSEHRYGEAMASRS